MTWDIVIITLVIITLVIMIVYECCVDDVSCVSDYRYNNPHSLIRKERKEKKSIGEIEKEEKREKRRKRQNFVKRGNKRCGAKVIQEKEGMS